MSEPFRAYTTRNMPIALLDELRVIAAARKITLEAALVLVLRVGLATLRQEANRAG